METTKQFFTEAEINNMIDRLDPCYQPSVQPIVIGDTTGNEFTPARNQFTPAVCAC